MQYVRFGGSAMKIHTYDRWPLLLFQLGLLSFFLQPCHLNAREVPGSMRGIPFTASSTPISMPAAWQAQPIKHAAWAKGADLAILADSHIASFLVPLIKQYGREHGLKMAVREGSCGVAMGMLRQKRVDMGGFCCPPAASDRLPGLQFHTLGISPLAILTHPDLPLENLSSAEVRHIFQGRLLDWNRLESNHKPTGGAFFIQPVVRPHCKQRPGHWRLILDRVDDFSLQKTQVRTTADMIAQVGAYKGSIGYEEIWNLKRFRTRGMVRPIRVDGADPYDRAALLALKYPFYRVHNLTTWKGSEGADQRSQALIRYLLQHAAKADPEQLLIPPEELRRAGWIFRGTELVGEPK